MQLTTRSTHILAFLLLVAAPTFGNDLSIRAIQAFVVGDGTVIGQKTDFVVDLGQSPDPAIPGIGLPANSKITLVLSPEFVNQNTKAFLRPIIDPPCVPFPAVMIDPLDCNTLAFPQGWPQAPVAPPLFSGISYDPARNAVTATVGATDIVPFTAPVGPGIKTLHAILNGFTNPEKPGMYPISVEIDEGGDGTVEHLATTQVHIIPRARRAIGIMSFCNDDSPTPPNPNSIYQRTSPGISPQYPYDLVLWEQDAAAMNGVSIQQVSEDLALLRQGRRTVGQVMIDAPSDAEGMMISSVTQSGDHLCGPFVDRAPLTGVPAAFLRVLFTPGDAVGLYTLRFSINGGNEFSTFVQVDD